MPAAAQERAMYVAPFSNKKPFSGRGTWQHRNCVGPKLWLPSSSSIASVAPFELIQMITNNHSDTFEEHENPAAASD